MRTGKPEQTLRDTAECDGLIYELASKPDSGRLLLATEEGLCLRSPARAKTRGLDMQEYAKVRALSQIAVASVVTARRPYMESISGPYRSKAGLSSEKQTSGSERFMFRFESCKRHFSRSSHALLTRTLVR